MNESETMMTELERLSDAVAGGRVCNRVILTAERVRRLIWDHIGYVHTRSRSRPSSGRRRLDKIIIRQLFEALKRIS